jgi:hypothetical protein
MKIKTTCGLEKYDELKRRTGFLAKLRLRWFVIFGSIRDILK